MQRRLSLPTTVYLRCAPQLPVGEAYERLGITRGWAYQLRQRHGFPSAPGGMVDTQRLATWLSHPARGCQLIWV